MLTSLSMMSKVWCEANNAAKPVDKRKGVENAASVRANGTGPFRLRSREPGVRTVLVRNQQYWGKIEGNVDQVVWTPIGNDATRVAALKSGEIDLMQPAPVQDVERLKQDSNLTVLQGPELRTIFLGMDQKRDELLYSNVKGKNPFKDRRVRQAFFQAIDIEAIKTRMLARVGVKVSLEAESKATYFPKILSRNTSFYLLGWTPTTYDVHNTLYNIMATPTTGQGVFNLGSYSNAKFDELTSKIGTETDPAKRNAMIAEAMKLHADDFGHIPLHQQALAWAMRKNVTIDQRGDNIILYRTAVVK